MNFDDALIDSTIWNCIELSSNLVDFNASPVFKSIVALNR